MKRLFIGLVAVVMSVSVGFAQQVNSEKEPFLVDSNRLSTYLALESSQVDEVSDINDYFIRRQQEAISASPTLQEIMLTQAVHENLQFMKYLLTSEQYRKYVTILNVTNNNNRNAGQIAFTDMLLANN